MSTEPKNDPERQSGGAMARPGHEYVAAVREHLQRQRWAGIEWWQATDIDDEGLHRRRGASNPASVVADVLEAAAELGLLAVEQVPAGPVRLTVVRDERGHFLGHESRDCGEHRTVGEHRAWCYDCHEWCSPSGPCARCQAPRDRAEIECLRSAAPLATQYLGDGQASAGEFYTQWSVRLPGSRFPVGTTRDEAKARQVLAEWRAERQEAGATGPEPELIRRLVSEWVPADASIPEEHDRTEAGR